MALMEFITLALLSFIHPANGQLNLLSAASETLTPSEQV